MKIFLSAVSSQFKDCRKALASDLRAMRAEVTVQEDFTVQGYSLLEKLEQYIAGCDRIVALVGDAYGWEPPASSFEVPQPRRSFTQWEYFFARGERLDGSSAPAKPVYVYFATPEYLAQYPARESEELRQLQREFTARIRAEDKDRGNFGSLHELRANVLRDGFQLSEHHKPNNLPLHSLGTLFKGRDKFLHDLHSRLVRPGTRAKATVAPQVLHGLGGVGKTRAALEYAWRFAADYDALLFVSAPNRDELRTRLANLAGVLGIEPLGAIEPNEDLGVGSRLSEVFLWLDRHPGWLLIIDNADSSEAVTATQEILSRLTAGHVLITSRVANWRAGVEPLEVDLLAEADAVAFLLERTPHRRVPADDPATAATIVRELGRLALALEQAGAFIERNRLSLGEYLDRWRSNRSDVLRWHDPNSMDYPASVAATWRTTFDQLSGPARRLLASLSWLAPEPLPLSFFESEPLIELDPDPRSALTDLVAYSFARFTDDGSAVEIHRLVQEITRNQAAELDRSRTLRVALDSITSLAPDAFIGGSELDWVPFAPHAAAAVSYADGEKAAEPTAKLMTVLGRHLRVRGQFAAAEAMTRRALEIAESSLGPDHPLIVSSLNTLGLLLKDTNRPDEAELMLRRALQIAEDSLGSDHPNIAIRLNNLGTLLWDTRQSEKAELMYRRALEIDLRSFGPDHPSVATDLNNLGLLLRNTNRSDEAESLLRRALEIDERSLGPDHPNIAIRLNNLGTLLLDTKRPDEAEPLFRRALEIDERSYGPDHPNVAIDLNNLGALLCGVHRLEEAAVMLRRALDIAECSFGPDHPDIAIRLNNLGTLLQRINRPGEAEPMLRRALEIVEGSLGPDHPRVVTTLNNLTALLQTTNRSDEAEPLARRGLEILILFRERSGYEHPNFRQGLKNYRSLLTRLGWTPERIQRTIMDLIERTLEE